jgi:hypothetical protein
MEVQAANGACHDDEVGEVQKSLDSRYDGIMTGRIAPIDGEAFFEELRQREEALTHRKPK